MSTPEPQTHAVAQTTLTDARIQSGPTITADDTSDPLRDGHEVGVLLARPHRDAEYRVDRVVDDVENLPDAAFDSYTSLFAALDWDEVPGDVIAARARLYVDYGEDPSEDTVTFTDIQILQHECLTP